MNKKQTKKIKKHYLACIWCGGNIPDNKPYAKYCSTKCKKEALGQKIANKLGVYMPNPD